MIPGADLISTFSFAMGGLPSPQSDAPYTVASTSCEGQEAGLYAGCMTAPCQYLPQEDPDGPLFAQCACPTYIGDFQVGQPQKTLEAAAGGSDVCHPGLTDGEFYVWSAANTVAPSP